MLYTINVCVALHRREHWLLIVRSPDMGHAGGTFAVVGGHFEVSEPGSDVLEATARREAAEEVGVDLTGVALTYAESTFFIGDTGNEVLNVVFAADLPPEAVPAITAPEEVAELGWWTLAELEANPTVPPWTLQNIRQAAAALSARAGPRP